MDLHGKTAVITGNPYGIGRASADLFTTAGARVICLDDSSDGWNPCGADGPTPPDFLVDVTNEDDVRRVAGECARTVEGVDILFNLAGRVVEQSFEATTGQTWATMIGRNLTAAFVCAQGFLPLMKRRPGGCIINHGSIDGVLGNPSIAAYSAAKGGLVSLTHVMAHDLGRYGLRVNCISTGGIRDGVVRPKDATLVALTPSRRTGTPEDVAQVALFLAGDAAGYVNGANIVVDGGRSTITQGCCGDHGLGSQV